MTIQKLIDKYLRLEKSGYETITINEALIGLRQIQLSRLPRKPACAYGKKK